MCCFVQSLIFGVRWDAWKRSGLTLNKSLVSNVIHRVASTWDKIRACINCCHVFNINESLFNLSNVNPASILQTVQLSNMFTLIGIPELILLTYYNQQLVWNKQDVSQNIYFSWFWWHQRWTVILIVQLEFILILLRF